MKPFFLFSLILVILFSASCTKKEVYPDIPVISFSKVELRDTTETVGESGNKAKLCRINFSIIDGDGNIGIKKGEDTTSHDFFAEIFQKKNGEIQKIELVAPYKFRLPYIEPEGQNKLLKADIMIDFIFNYYNNSLLYDSVMYKFYINDRDGNISNTVETPVFSLKSEGVFYELK